MGKKSAWVGGGGRIGRGIVLSAGIALDVIGSLVRGRGRHMDGSEGAYQVSGSA